MLAAQSSPSYTQTWRMDPLRAGYCVEFLMTSDAAREQLPKGLTPVPASAAPSLHPVVQTVVSTGPDSFATLVPSELCLYWAQTVDVDGRQIAERENRAQVVGIWSILARPAAEGGTPVHAAVRLYASNWRAARLAEAAHMDFTKIDAAAGKVPIEDAEGRLVPGPDDRYEIRVGKTMVTWDGRFAGDTAYAPAPETHAWRAMGRRETVWTVRSEVQPEGSAAVVGALRVIGRDDLARALQGSPIRHVGTWHSGGNAQLVFSR
jgi:hypothetical protein